MKLPLQIEFRNLVPLPSLEGEIRDRVARLEEFVTGEHHGHEQLEVAMRGSFDTMARRLEDHQRRRRGQIKQHTPRRGADGGLQDNSAPS